MTKEEAVILLKRIENNFYQNLPDNWNELKKEWGPMLLNKEYETINKNISNYIETNIYFPKLAQIVKVEEYRTGPYIPGVEETQKYIEEMKKYEEESCSKETAMKYLEKIRKVLDR